MRVRLLLPWYKYPPFGERGIGGLSVTIWELTHQLVQAGVSVHALTPQSRDLEETKDVHGVSVSSSLTGTKFLENRSLSKAEEALLLGNYDAIFSVNNYGARTLHGSAGLAERVVRQIHTLAHDRTLDSYVSMKPGLLEYAKVAYTRHAERRAEKLLVGERTVCVSNYLRTKALQYGVALPQKIFHIPNGVDTTRFRPLNKEKRYDLIFIGRFQKAKGLDLLLNALRLLRTKGLTYSLGIAGEFRSGERQYLINTYCKGIEDSVTFLGTISRQELPEILNSARLLVAPSRYESFGLPSLEAIACGVPVIASEAGGLTEIVDNRVGRIFANGSVEALARSIYESNEDHEFYDQSATRGPEKAKNYDWNVVVGQIIRLLRQNSLAG